MKSKSKKILSILMCLCLIISTLTVSVVSAEGSFNPSVIAELTEPGTVSVTTLSFGEDEDQTPVYVKFTPSETGYYIAYSEAETDPYAWLYNSEYEELCYNDDYFGDENYNFCLYSKLTGGEVYYIEIGNYDGEDTFDVVIEQVDEDFVYDDGSDDGNDDDYLTSGDYKYQILDDGTVEIKGYIGSATELEIPAEIDGKAVTSIGDGAFYGCESLTSITIPDSVTSIGDSAFSMIKRLAIYGTKDSYVDKYCAENDLWFKEIGDNSEYAYKYPLNKIIETLVTAEKNIALKACNINNVVQNIETKKSILYNDEYIYSTSDYVNYDSISISNILWDVGELTQENKDRVGYYIDYIYCVGNKAIARICIEGSTEDGGYFFGYTYIAFNSDLTYSILNMPGDYFGTEVFGTSDIFRFNDKYMVFSENSLYISSDLLSWDIQHLDFNIEDYEFFNIHYKLATNQYIYLSICDKLCVLDEDFNIKHIDTNDFNADNCKIHSTSEFSDKENNQYDKINIVVENYDEDYNFKSLDTYSFDEKKFEIQKTSSVNSLDFYGWLNDPINRPIVFQTSNENFINIYDRNNYIVDSISCELDLMSNRIYGYSIFGVSSNKYDEIHLMLYSENDKYYILMTNDYFKTIYKAELSGISGKITSIATTKEKIVFIGENVTSFDYQEFFGCLNTRYINDEETGVGIESMGNEIPLDSVLDIDKTIGTDSSLIYNISIKNNEQKMFKNDLLIKLPFNYDLSNQKVCVLQENSEGEWDTVDYSIHNTNIAIVYTNSLNRIKILTKTVENSTKPTAPSDTTTVSPEPTTAVEPTNPTEPSKQEPTTASTDPAKPDPSNSTETTTIKPTDKPTVTTSNQTPIGPNKPANTNVTTSTVKATTTSFKVPKVKAKASKGKISLTLKKVKGTSGYQVRYKVNGKWKVKTFKIKKNATKVIKKLKKGSYKVQVRLINNSKKSLSNWSKAKTVKVK